MAIFPMPHAMVPCGTKKTIWVAEFAPRTMMLKLDLGLVVAMLIVMEISHVLDVDFEIKLNLYDSFTTIFVFQYKLMC